MHSMRGVRPGMPDEGHDYSGTLNSFELSFKESRIVVYCDLDSCREARKELEKTYTLLEGYIRNSPFYQSTYEPLRVGDNAPGIVQEMAESSRKAGCGPMACVAGAFSEHLRDFLLESGATEAIVENGGDIALKVNKKVTIGLYAGSSPYSGRIALKVKPEDTPLGVCTSSASVGHSISLGEADSVTVLSDSTPLADGAATAIANQVRGANPVQNALMHARKIEGIRGAMIVLDSELGCWGSLPEIIRI
ncbi:MAG: UPF0280 family protein [Candidatus Altiarchaeota archaeon]|nr:UPF0280 family protein [Candidatus Altiarchaeota archaeon]